MGAPKKTPEQQEAAAMDAYELRCRGLGLRAIAAELKGPPHFCGGHTTARAWVELGRALVVGEDSNRGRRARREMAIDALDEMRVEMAEDVKAGRLDREAAYRLKIRALEVQAQLGGWRAAPQATKAKLAVSGTTTPELDPDLLRAIAAIPQHEWPLLPTDDEGDPER